MAFYQHAGPFVQVRNVAFDTTYGPGNPAPYSGIYRCEVCGYEDACNEHQPLPPQSRAVHWHTLPVRWRLICIARHKAA